MSKLYLENGWLSMNKAGELLCGDHVETVNREDSVIMVLADGLGSGVKASILSTLTSKILATMLAGDMTVEDSVETIALTLPVCAVRQVAYCTFTILQVDKNTGEVYLVQFDNPDLILLRGGKIFDYPKEKREIAGKTIYETRLMGRTGDLYIMMSDGAVHAGVGTVLNFGWQQPEIAEYAQRVWTPDLSAKSMAAKISDACRELYMDIPGDDTTIAALRIRQRQQVNLMIGPPMDPAQDEAIMGDFFALEGKTIVCGGTTRTVTRASQDNAAQEEIPAPWWGGTWASPFAPPWISLTRISPPSLPSRGWTLSPRGSSPWAGWWPWRPSAFPTRLGSPPGSPARMGPPSSPACSLRKPPM